MVIGKEYDRGFQDGIAAALDAIADLETEPPPVKVPNMYRMGRCHGTRTMQMMAMTAVRKAAIR